MYYMDLTLPASQDRCEGVGPGGRCVTDDNDGRDVHACQRQAHHQMGHAERTVQRLKRSAEKLHEMHPELNAEAIMFRVTNVHNELGGIKRYSAFQWTSAHS